MDKEKEKEIIILALKKGLIDLNDLQIPEDISIGKTISKALLDFSPRLQMLVSKGILKEEEINKLKKELEMGENEAQETKEKLVLASKESPKKRYKIIKILGEGGMGKVYKAHDTKLNRYVALKFLKENDPIKQKRFLQEAQAQAKLKSEAICKIYEVGEMDGVPFISMQYIEGENLRNASKEMSLEMKLNIIKKVSDGLQEAHKLGILHRDINPSNIMVEKDENGEYKPYILDFGLAKEISEPGITQDGLIMGTLYYMSPEQAKGQNQTMDRRADVYSIGATLYEIVTGKPPFEGSFTEVLENIYNKDPEPLRKINPYIPKDVEIIVLKCLEKEPVRRYDSAKSLSEDIEKFLNGEPIKARPKTLFYYFYKKIRKNKFAFLTILIALIIILFFSSMWVNEKINSKRIANIMQKFGEDVKEVESIMRYSHMLPVHNNSYEKEMVLNKINKISKKMKEIGKIGEGPGNYAIGRAYMSLGDFRKAYNYFQIAYNKNYKEPEFFYCLGLVLGEIYQEELKDVENIKNREIREAKRKEIEGKFKEPALKYIQESKSFLKEMPDYAEALIYFYEKKYDSALKKAEDAAGKTPWLYEIYKLKADIHSFKGGEKENIGELEGALNEYNLSETEYLKAKEIGRSDVSIYLGQGNLMRMKMRLDSQKGMPDEEIFKKAKKEVEEAIKIDPNNEKIYNLDSLINWSWANELFKYGKNPLPVLENAIKSAEFAIKLNKDFTNSYNNLGVSYIIKSTYEEQNGIDNLSSINESIANYEKALKIEPWNMGILTNLGNAYTMLVDYYINKGKDPLKYIEKAIENYDKATEIYPDIPVVLNNSGIIYQYKAEYEKEKGKDPRNSLSIAIERQKKAVEKNPGYTGAYLNLGVNYAEIASFEISIGISPEENFKISNEYYKKALSINPNYPKALNNLAANYVELSKYKVSVGENPFEFFKLAEETLNSVIKLDNSAYPINDFGELYYVKGLNDIKRNNNPDKNFNKALEYFEKAINLSQNWTTPFYNKALLYLEYAKFKVSNGKDPIKDFEEAEKEMEFVLSINGTYYLYNETMAEVLLGKAEYFLNKNKDVSKIISLSEKFIENSIKANAKNKNIYNLKEKLEKIKKVL